MRIRQTVSAVGLVLFFWSAAAPITARQATPGGAPAESADHDALRAIRAVYEQAVRQAQPDLLAPHLSSEFHGVMVTGRVVKSLADLTSYWQEIRALIGEGGSYTTTLNPELSVLLGDIALARGTSDDVVVTGQGDEYRFTTFWTATLRRENGGWKIQQVQGTMNPVANEFVRRFSRRAMFIVGGIAGAIGVIVGAVLMGLTSRRRPRVRA
jgi:ketosteroid isomerase-like protein